ncbi:XANTHINE/URACIL PERMEASE C887.17-RELATED [Salix purpurea]|uniref:XANTHINE/URACIL PERMEASE C887.17-RELATED n=1 Tax=Salix purpurea TaxID=77065 RepID=A0A9Q0Q419_SALPP|nr:XANTHINE/URACIL PERMEASE C887.17-RELATED [Salix purpurea]
MATPPQPSSLSARLNTFVAKSRVGKRFKLVERKTTFTTEVRAGTTTFLTMAYILAVNGNILADSGGTCSVSDCIPLCSNPTIPLSNCTASTYRIIKPDESCKFNPVNPGYADCLQKTRKDLIVATVASSLIGCLIMGVLANLPLALAPGMGTNAYFTYTVVGFHGSGYSSSTLVTIGACPEIFSCSISPPLLRRLTAQMVCSRTVLCRAISCVSIGGWRVQHSGLAFLVL